MKGSSLKILLILTSMCICGIVVPRIYAQTAPTVGAIYFPGWYTNPDPGTVLQLSKDLVPSQWHYRLPFYTTFTADGAPHYFEDSQATIDKEIELAKAAGINYFTFEYCGWCKGLPLPDHGYGLYYYLSSSKKSDLNFTLMFTDFAYDVVTVNTWETDMIPRSVTLMKDGMYQKVVGNRPLLYIFGADHLSNSKTFGSIANAKKELDLLRQKASVAGLGNPYIVGLMFEPITASLAQMGFDAVSSYTAMPCNSTDHSYKALADHNKVFWDEGAAAGYPVVPIVNTGWDYRPFVEGISGYGGCSVFDDGTPDQIASNLQNAKNWISAHPQSAGVNSILIYAWNELVEGGWLSPTIYEGDARLEAISKVIKGTNFNSPRYKGSDLNGDRKIDIYDYNILVSNFDKTMDPIPVNADITGDGKVDIFDYNSLVGNYGK